MHLVEDDLKNPCLDYIEHIIFAPPGAKFVTKTKTYDDFDAVKADFMGGKLSEDALKEALVKAVNILLEPVRAHFKNNAKAKSLLESVKRFKKETAEPKVGGKEVLKRMTCDIKGPIHALFCPPLGPHTTLGTVFSFLNLVQAAPEGNKALARAHISPSSFNELPAYGALIPS
jgi:tyrosyl-tRNA synthetase